jgi:hypothetical protein
MATADPGEGTMGERRPNGFDRHDQPSGWPSTFWSSHHAEINYSAQGR